jgi:acetyl-CoA acetyltransferase
MTARNASPLNDGASAVVLVGAGAAEELSPELRLRELRHGLLGVCVGSGQGVALVLENPRAA